jgi:hypothetical protein
MGGAQVMAATRDLLGINIQTLDVCCTPKVEELPTAGECAALEGQG